MTPLLRRLGWLTRRARHEAELGAELAFHLEEDTADRIASGALTAAAARAAKIDLGNMPLLVEDARAMWIRPSFERFVQDLRYAFRRMRQAPVFTAVAIGSLALGIGANAAVFSLFNEALLRPLPVPDPAALVNFTSPGPRPGGVSCNQSGPCDAVFSYPMFRDLQRAGTVFTGIAAHHQFRANLAYSGQTLSGQGALVSGSYFPVLGLTPALGRLLDPTDDQVTGGAAVVVVAHDYWVSRFGAAPDVVGKPMAVNGQTVTIVGIAPKGFTGTTFGAPVQVFLPITMRGLVEPPFNSFEDRQSYWIYLFARRKPGVSMAEASTAINGPYHSILTTVDAPLLTGKNASQRPQFEARSLTLEPGGRGQSNVHRNAGSPLALLFAVTGIVLLIACANLANLLLARSAARSAELAIRTSIGASRRTLVVQLLIEACVLAIAGGLTGLAIAEWIVSAAVRALTADAGAVIVVHLDWRVIAFSAALSLATGLLFGVFPAFHSTKVGPASALKNDSGRSTSSRAASRFRGAMILAQMALSTLLLVSAGLTIRSLVNVSRVDLGIRVDHLVTFTISPRLNGYSPDAARDLFERTEAALSAMPGASIASASTVPLVAGTFYGTSVTVQDFAGGDGVDSNSAFSQTSPGFFETAGIPLLAGRDFAPGDDLTAPKVAIVNEAFAKKFKLGHSAVGKRMKSGSDPVDMEIVGLVRDARYSNVREDAPALFYMPYRQDKNLGRATFYVRTPLDPDALLKAVPAVMHRLDPNLPMEDLRTMENQVRVNEAGDRAITMLATAFALLATLLAAIGLYGVLAYTVAQRTREFGVRMALGAAPAEVRRLVLRSVVRLATAGSLLGALAALFAGRYLQTLLYQMSGFDPWVLGAAIATLTVVALAAGFVPAWRASRIDPMRALRAE